MAFSHFFPTFSASCPGARLPQFGANGVIAGVWFRRGASRRDLPPPPTAGAPVAFPALRFCLFSFGPSFSLGGLQSERPRRTPNPAPKSPRERAVRGAQRDGISGSEIPSRWGFPAVAWPGVAVSAVRRVFGRFLGPGLRRGVAGPVRRPRPRPRPAQRNPGLGSRGFGLGRPFLTPEVFCPRLRRGDVGC